MTARFTLRRADGKVYLRRRGWECRHFGIYVHRMDAPDPGVDLHNHPFAFMSLVLWGGYTEERCRSFFAPYVAARAERLNLARRGNRRHRGWLTIATTPLDHAHRIVELDRSPTWTLVIRGRKLQRWGFLLPAGWMDWEEYDRTVRAERRDLWRDDAPDT